ncbi:hypothetical protein LTV02_18425 [Nocardia yamanashiensis]|uniref:hypothetical protein n=1 Tax=Nocardia yamanashiensis TaxID=209247 RepID=UPI001E641E58|nr:hypothetical protein [Nocardia yamanashiensis]UGT45237.1 hypothetical protein LTV02_18425 [Nocardia yamanashiensis]
MTQIATRPGLFESASRIAAFTRVMYKPYYLLYAVLWVLALEGTAAVVAQPDTSWRPTGATAVRIVVVAAVLLYLRMVDEQKDLEYDRVHNPDRPLVTGAVSKGELRTAMGIIAAGAVAGSGLLSGRSALMIAAVLAYGLVLWGLEQASAAVRGRILLNLVVTYPVQLLITAYVLLSAIDTGEVAGRGRIALLALVFAGAFLQFEFARKTSRVERPGEMYYSNPLGTAGSIAVSLGLAALAVTVDLALVRPWTYTGAVAVIGWIPVALLLIPLAGAQRFRTSTEPDYPPVPAMLFIITLYATLIAQASAV